MSSLRFFYGPLVNDHKVLLILYPIEQSILLQVLISYPLCHPEVFILNIPKSSILLASATREVVPVTSRSSFFMLFLNPIISYICHRNRRCYDVNYISLIRLKTILLLNVHRFFWLLYISWCFGSDNNSTWFWFIIKVFCLQSFKHFKMSGSSVITQEIFPVSAFDPSSTTEITWSLKMD